VSVHRLLLSALLAVAPIAVAIDESRSEISPDDARLAAIITDPRLDEISGLAVSRRHPGILWTHNDSGDAAQLYALGTDGQLRATVQLDGVTHIDFEDIAGFELDGEPYLLVADVGDNGGIRRQLQLYVFREPETIADQRLPLAWSIRFRWPDGPRDCESVAVDPLAGEVLLASKKRVPPELFRLPLRSEADDELVAEPIAHLLHVIQPTDEDLQRNPVYGRYRSQITAIDLSPDGRNLAVLNYLQAYIYRRNGDEPWRNALRRQPLDLPFPWLAQAEAIAFDVDGRSVWIGTERLPAPLLRLPVPPE
jgi:hypothetical protein